jgi:hypothetical protein
VVRPPPMNNVLVRPLLDKVLRQYQTVTPILTVEWLPLLLRIREVQNLNIGPETDYIEINTIYYVFCKPLKYNSFFIYNKYILI